MVDSNIEKLLVLQDRDIRRHELETQLGRVPVQIEDLGKKIAEEETSRNAARDRIRQLEIERKNADTEIAGAEQQVARYKNQQLEVKKNEEYKALTHEIEATQAKIGEIEDRALALMIEIDEERDRLAKIEADFDERIRVHKEKIAACESREKMLRGELDEVRGSVEEARAGVPPLFLAGYDRQAKSVRFPVVAAIRDRKCQGCHLRVSGEVETEVRDKEKITTCDSCGRIVYLER